jgi:hypothetical protein
MGIYEHTVLSYNSNWEASVIFPSS